MGGNSSKPISDSKQQPKQPSAALHVAYQPQVAAAAAAAAVPNNPEVALAHVLLPPAMDWDLADAPYFLPVLRKIVEEYLAYDIQINSLASASTYSIFHQGEVKLYQQAFVIAQDHVLTAGPLDALKAAVIKDPRVLLPTITITTKLVGETLTLRGTLEELAMILLDHTIASDQGMAEFLRELRKNLLPPLAPQQARIAAPIEEKKDENLEATHKEVLNNIFNVIKQNNFDQARNQMKAYIKSLKPEVITDNKYFLNLLQLIPLAFNVLVNRVQELKNTWYGTQADQYCYTTAGVIETALSFMLRKRLKRGIYYLLNQNASTDRAIDVSDDSFIGKSGSNSELGVSVFFDDLGGRARAVGLSRGVFKLISAITSAQQNLCSDRTFNRRSGP